jgi:hypothetical protein
MQRAHLHHPLPASRSATLCEAPPGPCNHSSQHVLQVARQWVDVLAVASPIKAVFVVTAPVITSRVCCVTVGQHKTGATV